MPRIVHFDASAMEFYGITSDHSPLCWSVDMSDVHGPSPEDAVVKIVKKINFKKFIEMTSRLAAKRGPDRSSLNVNLQYEQIVKLINDAVSITSSEKKP